MLYAVDAILWGGTVVVPLLVALIVGGPAFFIALKNIRENREQHGDNAQTLQAVAAKVNEVDGKLDAVSTKMDQFIGRTEGWREHVDDWMDGPH